MNTPLTINDVAILTDDALLAMRDGAWVSIPVDAATIMDAGTLFDIGTAADCAMLAIAPGTALDALVRRQGERFTVASRETHRTFRAKGGVYYQGRRNGEREVTVLHTAMLDVPEWKRLDDPYDLYAAITYLYQVCGCIVTTNPGAMGVAMLRAIHRKRPDWLAPLTESVAPFLDHRPRDLHWSRPLTAEERALPYLYYIDKNAAYLGVMSGLPLAGAGYRKVMAPAFDHRVPGLWHARIADGGAYRASLPHPTDGMPEGWFDTATIHTARQLGYTVDITRSYLAVDHHATLTEWYESIKDAYYAMKMASPIYPNDAARMAVYAYVKAVYRATTGMFAHEPEHASRTALYRPDWYNAVIAASRARMMVHLRALADAGVHVVGVSVDELVVVSAHAEAECACAPLTFSPQIGKWKRKKTLSTAAYADIFEAPTARVWQTIRHLPEGGVAMRTGALLRGDFDAVD